MRLLDDHGKRIKHMPQARPTGRQGSKRDLGHPTRRLARARKAAGGKTVSQRMAEFIDRHRLLEAGQGVLVAISGGSDSVALLAGLAELATHPQRRYRLIAAHLNHGLVEDVGEDAEFIATLARRLKVPCICERGDVPAAAAAAGIGHEEAGRQVRYDFLRRAAIAHGCTAIATGQVETVLHRILRGTGLEGLAGIRPSRDLGGRLRLIRPLLAVTRQQAQEYLRRRRIRWKTDPTNDDPTYNTRNQIRHELLPLLRTGYNARVDEALARLAELAAAFGPQVSALGEKALADVLLERGERELTLSAPLLAALGAYPASLAVRTALRLLESPMQEMGQEQVEQVLALAAAPARGRRRLDLPGGLRVCRQYDQLILTHVAATTSPACAPLDGQEVPLAQPGRSCLPDGSSVYIEFRDGGLAELRKFAAGKDAFVEMMDADQLEEPLIARHWRAGDQFRPLGAAGRQKLSDFFISAKIPQPQRRRAWLLCDRRGLIWLAPHRLCHRVRVTKATRRLAIIRIDQ
jgi:tRNA(Ile)-lysidine synthase